jgi:hypothetical protein
LLPDAFAQELKLSGLEPNRTLRPPNSKYTVAAGQLIVTASHPRLNSPAWKTKDEMKKISQFICIKPIFILL